MYWLDIVAVGIIFFFGILGFSGLLNRFRGLVFGILLGLFIIGIAPFALSKYDTGFQVNTEKSIVMRYLGKLMPDSIKIPK